MPDISKCSNAECEIKNSCFRFTCIPNMDWQSYTKFESTLNKETGEVECNYFIENKNK